MSQQFNFTVPNLIYSTLTPMIKWILFLQKVHRVSHFILALFFSYFILSGKRDDLIRLLKRSFFKSKKAEMRISTHLTRLNSPCMVSFSHEVMQKCVSISDVVPSGKTGYAWPMNNTFLLMNNSLVLPRRVWWLHLEQPIAYISLLVDGTRTGAVTVTH